MTTTEDTPVVIHLDLRAGAAALRTPEALRAEVAVQLGAVGLPEPDDPLFLVVDTPAGLIEHQRQYEWITGYRAVGRPLILVLLVGSAPASGPDEAEPYPRDRRLVRPAMLRASTTGLLWAGDLRSARTALERPAPDDPAALAVLVDLLSVPDVFGRVLTSLQPLPDATAAPALRLLEQDLPPEIRDRAWRDALIRFAGADTDLASGAGGAAGWSDDGLPEPLRRLLDGHPGRDRRHRVPGEQADIAYHACVTALKDADDSLTALRAFPGLLSAVPKATFEDDLRRAGEALDDFRELVGAALRSDGGSGAGLSTAETASRLAALGLRIPQADGVGERIGDGLRAFARQLLREGLALRSVAQRFTRLAGRVEPLPGSALLSGLDRYSARAVADRTARQSGTVHLPSAARRWAAGAAGLLGALWPVPVTPLALLVPLLFAALAVIGGVRLPGTGKFPRWAAGPTRAALGGAVAGALIALTGPPPWLSTIGLLLGLGITWYTARGLWQDVVDAWVAGHGTAVAREALTGLDGLLADAVNEHWAAKERLYCADAARSAAGMLRATAEAAEAEAAGPESGTAAASPAAADDWLSAPSSLDTDGFAPGDSEPGPDQDTDQDTDWARAYAWENRPAWEDPAAPGPAAPDPAAAPPAQGSDGRGAGTPRWLDRETGEGGPELVAALAGDLMDAAMLAMDPYLGVVERGQAGALAVRRTEERVRDLLSTARRHLRRNGVLAPPQFADENRERGSSASLLGTDPRRPADLVGAEPDRRAVVQLSSPEQAALLSGDPAAAVWIRLAPQAVRGEVEKVWQDIVTAPSHEVLWTSTGRYAGLIRLTPLRLGVVDTVRLRHSHPVDRTGGHEEWEGAQW